MSRAKQIRLANHDAAAAAMVTGSCSFLNLQSKAMVPCLGSWLSWSAHAPRALGYPIIACLRFESTSPKAALQSTGGFRFALP